jgi:hypothetical protein
VVERRHSKSRNCYAIEDIFGKLISVTWNIEEARQLVASQIIKGKTDKNLIAIRRIPLSLVSPPMTESGSRVEGATTKTNTISYAKCSRGSSKTLGYCIEEKSDVLEIDMRSAKRIRVEDHFVTVGCPKGKWNDSIHKCDISNPVVIAIWHPAKEATVRQETHTPFELSSAALPLATAKQHGGSLRRVT